MKLSFASPEVRLHVRCRRRIHGKTAREQQNVVQCIKLLERWFVQRAQDDVLSVG
jgi:hypothetical protein